MNHRMDKLFSLERELSEAYPVIMDKDFSYERLSKHNKIHFHAVVAFCEEIANKYGSKAPLV